jgi:hypothetical protein
MIHADAKEFLQKMTLEECVSLDIRPWRDKIDSWKSLHPFEKETSFFSTKNALNTIKDQTSKELDKYIFVTDV